MKIAFQDLNMMSRLARKRYNLKQSRNNKRKQKWKLFNSKNRKLLSRKLKKKIKNQYIVTTLKMKLKM